MKAAAHAEALAPGWASADGTRLAGRCWEPGSRARGAVLLVHGQGEHLGRYQRTGAALAAAGLRVCALELRGHGDSGGTRGHVRRWSEYVADLEAAAGALEGCVLLAHSMGALVALDFLRTPRAVRGLVLCSPLLGLRMRVPWWKERLGRALAPLAPSLTLASGIEPEWISRDPEVVRAYQDDPRIVRRVSLRWFLEMEAAIARAWVPSDGWRLPLQVHLAGDDRLVDTEAAQDWADRWPGPCEVLHWESCRHEILQEPERLEVIAAIADWIDRQSG